MFIGFRLKGSLEENSNLNRGQKNYRTLRQAGFKPNVLKNNYRKSFSNFRLIAPLARDVASYCQAPTVLRMSL